MAAWLIACVAGVQLDVFGTNATVYTAALCAGVLCLVGFLDDTSDLPRSLRYTVHLGVATFAVWRIGLPEYAVGLPGPVLTILAVVWITVCINTINFMDGMDGLVAGSSIIILCFLWRTSADGVWLLLAAALAGFLVFNLPPARAFMGDAGSTTLGGLLGIAFLSEARTRSLTGNELLVLMPIVGDAIYTLARRALRRENIFIAHHSHMYQRLLRAGHSHAQISASYAVLTAMLALLATKASREAFIAGLLLSVALVATVELYLHWRAVPFTRPALHQKSR